MRTRSVGARGADGVVPGGDRVAVGNRSVTWCPRVASAQVGACVPVVRVPARGHPDHRGVGVIRCPDSLRVFPVGLTVDPCLQGLSFRRVVRRGTSSTETTGASLLLTAFPGSLQL